MALEHSPECFALEALLLNHLSNVRNMEYRRIDQSITVLYIHFECGPTDHPLVKIQNN